MFSILQVYEPRIDNLLTRCFVALRLYFIYGDYPIRENEVVFIQSMNDLETLNFLTPAQSYWIECVVTHFTYTEVYLSCDILLILPNKPELNAWLELMGENDVCY